MSKMTCGDQQEIAKSKGVIFQQKFDWKTNLPLTQRRHYEVLKLF